MTDQRNADCAMPPIAITKEVEDEAREAAVRRSRFLDGIRLRHLFQEIDALRSRVAELEHRLAQR